MNPIGSQFYYFRDIDQFSTTESSMTESSMTEGDQLDQWARDVSDYKEKDARREAVKSIMAGKEVLSLVNVSSFPPIPESIAGKIRRLELHRMGMNSLEGLPWMKELEYLNIRDCGNLNSLKGLPTTKSFKHLEINGCDHLESLKGMPESMKYLQKLEINECSHLESLRGMPKNMEYLQELVIAQNMRLESLNGMPEKMNGLKSFTVDGNNSLESLDGLPSMMDSLENLDIKNNKNLSDVLLNDRICSNAGLRISFVNNENIDENLLEHMQLYAEEQRKNLNDHARLHFVKYNKGCYLNKIQVWNSRR